MFTKFLRYTKQNLTQSDLSRIWQEAKTHGVEAIDISQNSFGAFPLPTAPLPAVKLLNISYNQTAMAELTIDATLFPNLEYLYVYESNVKRFNIKGDLPILKEINLAKNALDVFVLSIVARHKNLAWVALHKNAIQNIGKEYWDDTDNCLPALRAYIGESSKGTVVNNRAKLIIVGNGRVGKTSLCNVLKGAKFNAKEKFTHGINLCEMTEKNLPVGKDKTLRLKVWDFGGQQIFYALHQFFLSENAVYILAWTDYENVKDYEKEPNQPVDEKWRTEEYWLENIKHLGKDSPIIMVRTHCDRKASPKNFAEYEQDIMAHINFSAENKDGLSTLKIKLKEALEKIPQFGKEEPITYENVIAHIEKLKETKTEITYQEFEVICALKDEEGRCIEKGNERALLQLLKHRGIVLHYDTDDFPALKNIIYINTEAITEQVYGLINNDLIKEKGEFDETYIQNFLLRRDKNKKDKTILKWLKNLVFPDYQNENKRKEFVALLLKFKLIFKNVKDTKTSYIAPQYLPVELSEESQEFYNGIKEELKLSFAFSFPRYLPDNVLVNFWSEYGPFSQKVIWRTGIFFTKNKQKYVVLYEEKDEKGKIINKLSIYSKHAPEDHAILAEIYQQLIGLSRSAYAEISLNGQNFVDYKALEEERKYDSTTIKCTQNTRLNIKNFDFLFVNIKEPPTHTDPLNPPMHPNIQNALNHIAEANYVGYFDEMDELLKSIPDISVRANYAGLKEKFTSGQYPANFFQTLEVFAKKCANFL